MDQEEDAGACVRSLGDRGRQRACRVCRRAGVKGCRQRESRGDTAAASRNYSIMLIGPGKHQPSPCDFCSEA